MNKITFDSLEIEVTRRCNMRCPHCMKGEPQDVDIKLEDIDALLDQIEMIGILRVTGGEPTLNLDAVEYMAEAIIKRGIPVLQFQIITNGLIYEERLVAIAKRFRQIIDLSCQNCYPKSYNYVPISETCRVLIGVSLDRYHEQSNNALICAVKYMQALSGIADIGIKRAGNAPMASGRAKTLNDCYVTPYEKTLRYMREKQIAVLSKDNKPGCIFHNNFNLCYPEQKLVCCSVSVNAYGYIVENLAMSYEDNDQFPKVCHVTEDIWDSILRYNQNRLSCTVWNLGLLKYGEPLTEQEVHKTLFPPKDSEDYNLTQELVKAGMRLAEKL